MRRELSTWRTWVWGPGFFLFFATVASGMAWSLLRGGIQLEDGTRAPGYVSILVIVAMALGLGFVARLVRSTSLVSLDGDVLRVRRLIRSWEISVDSIERALLDRDASWQGQHPIRLDFRADAPVRTARFLLHEQLDRGDLEQLIGVHVEDDPE